MVRAFTVMKCAGFSPITDLADYLDNNRIIAHYKTIPDNYRLSIDRELSRFMRTYAPRAERERRDSRFKASGQERLWVRNGKSAASLNTLAHSSALAAALAAVPSDPRHSYRSAKPLRRTA